MSGWPDVAVPCRGNPDLWEIPTDLSRALLDVVYRDVLAAVEKCVTCPALNPCARWAVLHPPQNAVQAAAVFGHDRKPRRPKHWRENVRTRGRVAKSRGRAA